ncbi:ATP-binding protein [Roseivirga pacifica]|uniref:ATP-binding protein n=1 Tax=Roseivirga pacifica TaxID=1267423 RepID=UPI003BB0FCEB
MTGNSIKTNRVFGVSNEKVESYIQRTDVDNRFLEGLSSNKHIVVYGASKQGKTALTNRHLDPSQFVRVDCAPNSTALDLYKSILRQENIEFQETRTTENGTELGGTIGAKAKVKIPWVAEAEIGGEGEAKKTKTESVEYKSVDFNLNLAQDIAEIISKAGTNKRIILENFHYLDEDVQQALAFDLRIFEDHKILFIVLGIWREKNRLSQFNGDLLDRMIEVPVEPWKREDFLKVLREGEPLLNVSFANIEDDLIESAFDSIGVFQELCKYSCIKAGVEETSEGSTVMLTKENLHNAEVQKLEDYSSRHIRCLESFIEQKAKTSDKTPLYLAYYFVKGILESTFDDITKGFKRKEVQGLISKDHHRPEDVRPSDMGYFLHDIVKTQVKKNIVPPIFDYDRSTRTLKVIDSTFYFFIKHCDKTDLLEELEAPEI